MKKINRQDLEKFMLENQDCYILISSDARFEDSEAEIYSFSDESLANTYIQQCIREKWLGFEWRTWDRLNCDADEMDIAYYIDDYLLEWIEKAGIKLV